MRPPIRLTITVLLLIGLMLVPVGCDRRSGDADEPGSDSASAEAASGEGQPMRLTDAGRERQAEARSASNADGANIAIDPRDEALAAHRLAATPRYPSDFVIGSLRTSGLSRLELAAREYAQAFLATLLDEGEPGDDAFIEPAPGARSVIDELVSTGLPAAGVRVARPQSLPGGETSVAYRVVGEGSSARGELILEMADGQWYTSDIQVVTSGPGADEPFDPALDSPRW